VDAAAFFAALFPRLALGIEGNRDCLSPRFHMRTFADIFVQRPHVGPQGRFR
jgi:hypothetical protein